jgi:hypothetical protein
MLAGSYLVAVAVRIVGRLLVGCFPSVPWSNVDETPVLHASAAGGKTGPHDCCSVQLVLLAASCCRSTLLS